MKGNCNVKGRMPMLVVDIKSFGRNRSIIFTYESIMSEMTQCLDPYVRSTKKQSKKGAFKIAKQLEYVLQSDCPRVLLDRRTSSRWWRGILHRSWESKQYGRLSAYGVQAPQDS
ncbi:hypothetical protein Tco_0929106 [Tanacetum coccineum]